MASSSDKIEVITPGSDSTEAPSSNFQQSLPKSMPSTSNAAPPSNLQQSPSKSMPSTSNEAAPPSNLQLSLSKSMPSTSTAAPPSLPSTDVIPNKSKFSIRNLGAIFKATKFCVSKPKPPENIIPDDDLVRLTSAWEKHKNHMNVQINLVRERSKERQKPGASKRDRDRLQKDIEKLINLQIPSPVDILSTTNKDDCHGGCLSPSSQMLCIDLDHVVSSFAEAKEYMDHMDEKIKQALEKFVELPKLGSSSQMANSDELRKANSYELRKALAKLKVQIPSHTKFRSADSNQPQMMCPNINAAREGAMHSNNKESKSADPGDSSGLLATFHALPERERDSLLCFFRFPPGATIKRTTMTHLWIANGFKPREQDCKCEENAANEVFDELIEKRFIELVNQKGSMAPDSCRMSLYVRSLLLEDAQKGGFTSKCSLDLDYGLLGTFRGLSEQERHSLLYFFRFPPETTIKRTMMTHLWLGQGFYARPWEQDCESEQKAANKVFDELIKMRFIKPVHQKCSSVPEYFRMSLSVHSLLLKDAQKGGFTSNGSLGQNQVGDGRMYSNKESISAEPDDYSGLLATFGKLARHVSNSLLCFSRFPPEATIKRTMMTHLWIGQGFCASPWVDNCVSEEDVANKVFDELIEKRFIKPVFQNCSLVPDSCSMSLDVHSLFLQHAERKGFTSNGSLDLDLGLVGEGSINYEPKIFFDEGDIKSVCLGRWRSSATHHIELADDKILESLCGLKKLNKLRFLSLRGISMIMELPKNILKLQELRILDLRACHHLEAIPNKIGLLKTLTHLDMSECYFLEHMPKSLAQLKCLEVLKGFFIGDFNNKKQACTLSDLSKLSKLRKLNIYTSMEAFPRIWDLDALRKLDSLQKLTISWGGCSLQDGKIDKKNGEDKPTHEEIRSFANQAKGPPTLPSKLRKLDLQFFPNDTRPHWLTPVFLNELKKLYIQGGKLCDIGRGMEWTSVEILRLSYLSELKIDREGLQNIFPKLVYLEQVDCPGLAYFECKRGVWMDKKNDATKQLQEYFKSTSGIKSSSMVGRGAWDDYYKFPEARVASISTSTVPVPQQTTTSQPTHAQSPIPPIPERYIQQLPEAYQRYISHTIDVQADGHCGFRAIAAQIKGSENQWHEVRRELIEEIQQNKGLYNKIFPSPVIADELLQSLDCFLPNARRTHWMDSVSLGLVIASRYNIVLHTFDVDASNCFTHLPLRNPPVPVGVRREIAIARVNDHFVQVFLHPNYPVPPIMSWWQEDKVSNKARGWADSYEQRIHLWFEVMSTTPSTPGA